MIDIKKVKRSKTIKTIEVDKKEFSYICYPRKDKALAEQDLYRPFSTIRFTHEYQAMWWCICNPSLTYKADRRVRLR